MQGGPLQIGWHFAVGSMMVMLGSLALHGWWGKVPIPGWGRFIFGCCSLAIVYPTSLVKWPAGFAEQLRDWGLALNAATALHIAATIIGVAVLLLFWKMLTSPPGAPAVAKAA